MSNKRSDGVLIEPLFTRPERVAIVALGASSKSYLQEQMGNIGLAKPFDEVWTVNRGFRAFYHDVLFLMDDLRWVAKKKPDYAKWLKKHDKPIITSTAYPEFPMSVEYPLQEVMETIQDDLFTVNTIAYMVAYAIHIRVKEVSIYGADFCYPDGNFAESGGQAVAYLCGMMRHFSMTHRIPGTSTLLYANRVKMNKQGQQQREPYGYHRKREMDEEAQKEKELRAARRAAKT